MVAAPLTQRIFAVVALLFSLPACAGSLTFQLSLTGSQLTLTNRGDSSAYYPAVFRMIADGSWEPLAARAAPAELAPGARMQAVWPDMRPIEKLSDLERMQPTMISFFDQAGVGFGQISFFRTPLSAGSALKAGYASGSLQIDAPDSASPVRASWVLWPQEQGIRPIRLPVQFEHHPPPARRIEWRSQGRVPFRLDTGAGQPAVLLLHETALGYALQAVQGGGMQGKEQRAAWLDASARFYQAAWIALAIAAGTMLLRTFHWWRRRRTVA